MRRHILLRLLLVVIMALYSASQHPCSCCWAWMTPPVCTSTTRRSASSRAKPVRLHASSTTERTDATSSSSSSSSSRAASSSERVGFGQWLLDRALDSPLWEHVLVPQARQKIVKTAQANGIEWNECKAWLQGQEGPWKDKGDRQSSSSDERDGDNNNILHADLDIPEYYQQAAYHAYSEGNLCWEAALEVEIAAAAVGARNFPAHGKNGEQAFRDSFGVALDEIGASVGDKSSASISKQERVVMVDLGCGTGMSTRWLAQRYPQATKIIGLDLSPYFCKVGERLLELAPRQRRDGSDGKDGNGTWVSTIQQDDRIEYRWGNAADTKLPNDFCDVVNLQFVAHELPACVTCDIIREAHRILKPNGGQLWFCEMDFETPGYAAQRANPLLFSLIRATEPYLDDYADHANDIRQCLQKTFDQVTINPATGRHFAIVATKQESKSPKDRNSNNKNNMGTMKDLRFDEHGVYRVEDTHLKVWENKG